MFSPKHFLILVALTTTYTTAFDPLGMFKSQVRSLYSLRDTLDVQEEPENGPSGKSASDTSWFSFSQPEALEPENSPLGKSSSDNSWFSFNQPKAEVDSEPPVVRETSETLSTTEANVIYYSTKRTTNSVLGSLFELGVADIKASENSDEILNNDNNFSSDNLNLKTNNQYRKDNKPYKNRPEEAFHQENIIPDNLKPLAEGPAIMELMHSLKGLNFLPVVPMTNGEHGVNHLDGTPDSSLMKYLDTIRDDAWGQFKSLALSYTNWLEDEYKLQDLPDQLPLDLIKKVLNLGDRVNFLHVVGKRIDPGMASFLADQLQPLFNRIQHLGPSGLTGTSVSSTVGNIVNDAAMKALRQFTDHVLHVAGRFVSPQELDNFQKDLGKTSPLAAEGLNILLHGPPSKGRSFGVVGSSSRQGRQRNWQGGNVDRGYGDYDYGGGYGGYGASDDSYGQSGGGYQDSGYDTGGYGGGMSYQQGVYLDPYLILGGIGAAALLAFLAYRLIVTTARRKRSIDDLTFMDLSDVPSFVHSIYNMLETAEEKYSFPISNSLDGTTDEITVDNGDELSQGINALWWARNNATITSDSDDSGNENYITNVNNGCVRCALFDFVRQRAYLGHESGNNLVVAGIAHLLGVEKAGKLVDEVTGRALDGEQLTCEQSGNTCYVK